jgi:hypothetical protein
MRLMKTIGLCLAATFAISGLTAIGASAAPEFLHGGKEVLKTGFTVKSKTGATLIELGMTKYKIVCTSSLSTGRIKGKSEVENVVAKFKGCKAKESEELHECEVNSTSPLGGKEEIITKTLKGRIGEVLSTEAASERGLLLLPNSGTVYVTIKSSVECLPQETSEVKGSLVGEVKPVKTLKSKGELIYKSVGGKTQAIKKFVGESAMHELEIFEVKTPLESVDTVEYEEAVEVT